MTTQKQISDDLKNAMREKDQVRLLVLRNILSEITNELVRKGKKPSEELDNEDILGVIKRLGKQRKDSIEQFEKGGRDDLVKKEEEELKILEEYMPEMLSEEEIEKIVLETKEELGVSNMSGMGAVMGAVMKKIGQEADGNIVREIVQKTLN